ncbi:MAG TPA: hypothetical protein VJ464_30530 [Blastocatellia bacterium]|nr:hypothetical protein [Blastocatellia bacterium]
MSTMGSANQDFEHLVDAWVHKALLHGAETFDQLLIKLPGVYPSVVFESLKRLGVDRESLFRNPPTAEDRWQEQDLINPCPKINLPVPHPLDYDWRFSNVAIKRLLNTCLEFTDSGETVILLGTPTLLRTSINENYPRRVALFDASQTIINSFSRSTPEARAEQCDLLADPLPQIQAAAVIADPPWYEEHLHGFIWAATQLCREGGYVIVSIPPVGTRPGVEQDRVALFDWAHELGLTLLRLEPSALPYTSPPFEVNALRAEGLSAVSTEWRAGDLALFSRDRPSDLPRPRLPIASEGPFVEEQVGTVRIRIRLRHLSGFCDPSLISVVLGDILPSVSRRDERRRLIDVWTSGNRVFACHGTNVLQSILQSLANGQQPDERVAANLVRRLRTEERLLVSQAAKRIKDMIRIEEDENLSLRES